MNRTSEFARISRHSIRNMNRSNSHGNRIRHTCEVQGFMGYQHYSSCRTPTFGFLPQERCFHLNSRNMSSSSSQKSREDVRVAYPKKEDLVEPFRPINNSNEKPVVVILLGWAGSNHRQLSKYSEMYLKHGCVTVSYIAPISYTTFTPGKLPFAAEAIVKKLQENELVNNPTFIHAFSNNGSVMYSHVLRELARSSDQIPIDLKGSIFDSAPIRRVFGPFMKMMPTLLPQLGPLRYPVAGLVTFSLVLAIISLYLRYGLLFALKGERIPQPVTDSKTLKEHIPTHNWLSRIVGIRNHPFLFLYSKNDSLVATLHVESIAEVVKRRGNSTKMVLFSGSEHVQHYRQHPKEYEDNLRKFINDAMESNKKPIYWDELD